MTERRIVHRVEEGMDRREILCTTYQMRNFYRQMRDGYFTTLDVMNYIQHHQIVKWCRKGDEVLDVCCGRGLLLPMLRYHRKNITGYTGVDIYPRNAIYTHKAVNSGKEIDPEEYYPFDVSFVESNVAQMTEVLEGPFDVIVYTSAIEHMHKDMGWRSLSECRKLCHDRTRMILTCPNTPEGQDGYHTQYRAHVYEWKRSELIEGLREVGFKVIHEWGLVINKTTLREAMDRRGLGSVMEILETFIPSEWLCPILAPMFPVESKEIGFIAVPDVSEEDEIEGLVQLTF